MPKAERTQADDEQSKYSLRSALDCSDSKDMARQEFKEETDINILLAKFGVNQQQRQPQYGEADYTVDLQQSLHAVEQTKQAHKHLSPEIKSKYPTWQSMLDGMASGELAKDLETLQSAKKIADENSLLELKLKREEGLEMLKRNREAAQAAERIRRGEPAQKPKE